MKLRMTISKYRSWHLCQISLQIMLLPTQTICVLLFSNCKRDKVQHIHEQIVCVSDFYYPAYWIIV